MSTKFSPTPAELALVSQIFNQADPQKIGILTGDVAVKVFSGAKLQPTVLGEIWNIADEDNNGWLPKKGVTIALRLIGWAQKGEKITPELVNNPGPLPTIDGYPVVTRQDTGTPLAKSSAPSQPPLTAQEKAKFRDLFIKAGPDANGLLSGDKARDVFVRSKLDNSVLLQVWNLSDTQNRGALDLTDFTIAMYFIRALMAGQLTFVPTALPPGLYQQAGGISYNTQGNVQSHTTGNSGSFSPMSGAFPQIRGPGVLQTQYTGQSQVFQTDQAGFPSTSPVPPVLPARPTTKSISPFVPRREGQSQWHVTPSEKAASDKHFDELDTKRQGYIEGDVAVPFMLLSKLPEQDLARIWDLADISNDGKLTKDGFAIARYLIEKKLSGFDIPATLPPSLVPASMHGNIATSPFVTVPQPIQQEPVKDLLWDDTPPASATTTQPARHPEPPVARAVSSLSPTARDPFASSTFAPSSAHHDLLGDDEDVSHSSTPIHDYSAEIGNTQNQVNSTNRAVDTLKDETAQIEERLANQQSQLSALQAQLATAKAAYETETKALATFRERYATQESELRKTKEELIRAESELSAVRVEKAEIEGAFMRDKEDTRELQRKMSEVGQQVVVLKAEIEKAKKDARQQKGLLAIARRQLTSKDTEKAKTEKELEEVRAEVTSITRERTEAETELATPASEPVRADSLSFAAAYPLPSSPDPSSPAGSVVTGKSNNPFDKLVDSGGTPQPQPPLPFTGSTIPTPSIGDPTNSSSNVKQGPSQELLGFYDAFGPDSSPSEKPTVLELTNAEVGFSTPKPAPVDIFAGNGLQDVLSPSTEGESDHFVTPPTTATQHSVAPSSATLHSGTDAVTKFPALDEADLKFPDLIPGSPEARAATDLGSHLQEIEVHESDSDSEDEVPLADLASKSRTPQKQSPTVSSTVMPDQSKAPSFDDVFGITPSSANATVSQRENVSDSASAPIDQSVLAPPAVTPTKLGATSDGVGAFDEAMGTIPSSTAPNKETFTFESAFEDNFDFESASNTSPAPKNASHGAGAEILEGDSAALTHPKFPPPPGPPTSSTNGHVMEALPEEETTKKTFDDAFSGFDSGPSLNLDSAFGSSATKHIPDTNGSSPTVTFPPSHATHRAVSPSQSTSPTRTRSPPPRPSSPKSSSPKAPRPSTSSSKETHEKVKEPSTRHSKLSIRLPFGKKKKQQQQQQQQGEPVPPVQHLSPAREEPSRMASPAAGDDVEAVKQLTAMGFSRSDSISALERYGYDVPRALNSLLGAP